MVGVEELEFSLGVDGRENNIFGGIIITLHYLFMRLFLIHELIVKVFLVQIERCSATAYPVNSLLLQVLQVSVVLLVHVI